MVITKTKQTRYQWTRRGVDYRPFLLEEESIIKLLARYWKILNWLCNLLQIVRTLLLNMLQKICPKYTLEFTRSRVWMKINLYVDDLFYISTMLLMALSCFTARYYNKFYISCVVSGGLTQSHDYPFLSLHQEYFGSLHQEYKVTSLYTVPINNIKQKSWIK